MGVENRTSTVTINAAFLQEIKEVNSDLWDLLDEVKQLCGDPQHVQYQGRQVVEMLAELRDQLAMHFALRRPTGTSTTPYGWHLICGIAALCGTNIRCSTPGRDLADEVDGLYRVGSLPQSGSRVVKRFRRILRSFPAA